MAILRIAYKNKIYFHKQVLSLKIETLGKYPNHRLECRFKFLRIFGVARLVVLFLNIDNEKH